MFLSPTEVFTVIGYYKYWVIFPVAVLEGPIIIIISGFLVNLKFLNGPLTYFILVLAEILGDVLHYVVGVYWKKSSWIKKHGHILGYDEKSEAFLEDHFSRHKLKTLFITKFVYGLGTASQVAAGIAGVNFYEFLAVCTVGTIPKTLGLILVGYYVGEYYVKIDSYFQFASFITLALALIFIIYAVSKKSIRVFLGDKK